MSRYSHPAYAQITASRISGSTSLYGSDFTHQHFVRIRVNKSSLQRDLSTDWPMADLNSLVEVDLSEAQWASFVSSMNTGGGTQCTLRHLHGMQEIPELPTPEKRMDQFKDEARAACAEALAAINELRAAVADTKLSQKGKDELNAKAGRIESRLLSSLPFILDQFGEHMEHTVEKAKTEVNAYVTQVVTRAGLAALGKPGDVPVLKLHGE